MKYFIGYLIQGEAAKWHSSLAKSISEKFNTWKIYEKLPPHITIFYLSDIEDVEPTRSFLKNWISDKKVSGNFTISDFDRFDDKVVFARTEPDSSVRTTAEELIRKIKEIPGMTQENFPFWHPHATLMNRVSEEEIKMIWDYVATVERPNFVIPFDNVTIFRFEGDMKWGVDESFKFK
ncbi:MAG TPA: 2'-5' RNA ligase family protein [Candidatus Paceibacterota bacterium]